MKKININRWIFYLIIIFPISTILQGITFFDSINRILMAIMFILLILKNFKVKIKKQNVVIIFMTCVLYACSFAFTKGKLDNVNDVFYFPLWVLFFMWLKDNFASFKEILENKTNLVFKIVVIWNVIVLVSMFFKFSYSQSWGGELYFKSFSNGEHRFAGSCIFIIALSWILVQCTSRKKYFLLAFIPIISIYLSGTRTYLGVILIFLVGLYYLINKKKIYFYISIIPVILLLALTIRLTPMAEKISATSQDGYFGFWGTVTSGRTVFWDADLKAFSELNISKKILGNGYNFIYDVNEKAISSRIWGHNDFINILLTYGYMGVLIYLYSFKVFSNEALNRYNVCLFLKLVYYLTWLFNAMFNMVYTYICATLAIPFILYSLIDFERKNEEEKVNDINNSDSYIQ